MRSGRWLLTTVWLFLSLAAAGTAVAQNTFVGTWKLNQEKSQLAGDTMKFGPAAGDAIELGRRGNHLLLPRGRQPLRAAQRQRSHLETDQPRCLDHGVSQDRRQADEQRQLEDFLRRKNLTVTTSGVKANGDLYTDTAEYVRTAGTSGLIGAWKSTSVKLSSPNELTIQESGLDGLILKIAALKATASPISMARKWPSRGPTFPPGCGWLSPEPGRTSFASWRNSMAAWWILPNTPSPPTGKP